MEEFMKSPFWTIGSTICVIVVAAIVYFKYKKNKTIKEDTNDDVKIKRIKALSYEYIIDESKQLLKDLSFNGDENLSLSVVPNMKAVEFYNSSEGKHFFSSKELSNEERNKMILLSIMQNNKILITEIIVPEEINADYYDFVPKDKIYVKKIKLNNDL